MAAIKSKVAVQAVSEFSAIIFVEVNGRGFELWADYKGKPLPQSFYNRLVKYEQLDIAMRDAINTLVQGIQLSESAEDIAIFKKAAKKIVRKQKANQAKWLRLVKQIGRRNRRGFVAYIRRVSAMFKAERIAWFAWDTTIVKNVEPKRWARALILKQQLENKLALGY